MYRLLHFAMIGTLVLIGFWAISVLGELFREYFGMFIFLWFFAPVVAIWLNSQPVLVSHTSSKLMIMRSLLTGVAIAISLLVFFDYDQIRDTIGHKFVDGYVVTYHEDTDEYGRGYMASTVSTAHWYSMFELWVFEWLFIGTCVAIPLVTWGAADRAVERAIRKSANEDEAT